MNILIKNWKKAVFVSLVLGNGIVVIKSNYEIQTHMRKVCNHATKYAEKNAKPFQKSILVIVNPVSNNKNTLKNFKKYCEPILHSAGLPIESIKTCYVGHAKTLIENTDIMPAAVIVAGGEGTASEVVTGLMRTENSCPVAILPMGSKHSMPLLCGRLDFVKCLTTSILCILNGRLKYENVMKYELIENENSNVKPIYGLNCFTWGLVRDLDALTEKYWYYGYLKRHAAILLNAFSDNLSWKCSADLIYAPPCIGCIHCCQNLRAAKTNIYKFLQNGNDKISWNLLNSKNTNCNKKFYWNVETSNLTITSKFNSENVPELFIQLCSNVVPGFDFVKSSFLDRTFLEADPSLKITSRTIDIIPTTPSKTTFYSIDGEEYEVRPIKITIVPQAIQVFN